MHEAASPTEKSAENNQTELMTTTTNEKYNLAHKEIEKNLAEYTDRLTCEIHSVYGFLRITFIAQSSVGL